MTKVVGKFEGGIKEVIVRLSAAGGDRGVGAKCARTPAHYILSWRTSEVSAS